MSINLNDFKISTLTKEGQTIAPRTLSSAVYMNDGQTVQSVVTDLVTNNKKFLMKTSIQKEKVDRDGQKVHDIITPIERYDFNKFPMIVLINDVYIDKTKYTINGIQLVLNDTLAATLKRNDMITYIFHYIDIVTEDSSVNATSINNVRFFVQPIEPLHKIDTDVWFDTLGNQVKQFNGTEWRIIVSGNGGSGGSVRSFKHTTSATTSSNTVSIGIAEFNKSTDLLFVFQNSVYLEKDEDYTIPDNTRIQSIGDNWNGTETEQVFNFICIKNAL